MGNAEDKFRQEVVVTGFGGQGIILAGRILGMAASLGDQRESTLVQSYGPESRGGACAAQVIIADEMIRYPYVATPDLLICMSKAAWDKFHTTVKPGGLSLSDRDLVQAEEGEGHFSIPATRMAEKMGKVMMANIVMLGFATAMSRVASTAAVKDAVLSSVPKGTEELNIAAFTKGYEFGLSKLKGSGKKALGQAGVAS